MIESIGLKIVEIALKKGFQKSERNYQSLELFLKLGIAKLKKDFKSVYSHSLVKFKIDYSDAFLQLFIQEKVSQTFESQLYKTDFEEFKRIIEKEIHTNQNLRALKEFNSYEEVQSEVENFIRIFQGFIKKSTDPTELQEHNENIEFRLQMYEELRKKSIDFQIEKYWKLK